jgi:hypothetical protein
LRREAFELFGRDNGEKAILRNRGDLLRSRHGLSSSGEEHTHLLAACIPDGRSKAMH